MVCVVGGHFMLRTPALCFLQLLFVCLLLLPPEQIFDQHRLMIASTRSTMCLPLFGVQENTVVPTARGASPVMPVLRKRISKGSITALTNTRRPSSSSMGPPEDGSRERANSAPELDTHAWRVPACGERTLSERLSPQNSLHQLIATKMALDLLQDQLPARREATANHRQPVRQRPDSAPPLISRFSCVSVSEEEEEEEEADAQLPGKDGPAADQDVETTTVRRASLPLYSSASRRTVHCGSAVPKWGVPPRKSPTTTSLDFRRFHSAPDSSPSRSSPLARARPSRV